MDIAPSYRNYRQGFDNAAPDYDADYLDNSLWIEMRERVWHRFDTYFERGDRVLDVGCGTGIDTIHLAGRGVKVTATDISPIMIAAVEEKVERNGYGDLVETKVMGTDSLRDYDLRNKAGFDGIVSNFGPLNCEPNLAELRQIFRQLLRPGGVVVSSIMNRICLWEVGYYLLRGKRKKAFRRLGVNGTWVEVASVKMNVFYYSPREVVRSFSPHFETLGISGLPTFLPPLYLGHWLKGHETIHRMLGGIDTGIGRRYPFNRWGDHFLLELALKK